MLLPKSLVRGGPPANVEIFLYDLENVKDSPYGPIPNATFCVEHQRSSCRGGFEAVVAARAILVSSERRFASVVIPPEAARVFCSPEPSKLYD